jgi:predicted N-acetyltransferase YhbS
MCRINSKELTMEMVIKRASLVDAVEAFILVVRNYRKKGYIDSRITIGNLCALCMRLHSYLWKIFSFRDAQRGYVIVAKKNERVVGTISVEFNPTKLPFEKLFLCELAEIRSGAPFVYIGSFAVDASCNCTRLSLKMLRIVWKEMQSLETQIGICVVNPNHCTFYEHFGFYTVAIKENMPGLEKAPAALMAIRASDVRL